MKITNTQFFWLTEARHISKPTTLLIIVYSQFHSRRQKSLLDARSGEAKRF